MAKLCVTRLCVTKLYVTKLCVTKCRRRRGVAGGGGPRGGAQI